VVRIPARAPTLTRKGGGKAKPAVRGTVTSDPASRTWAQSLDSFGPGRIQIQLGNL